MNQRIRELYNKVFAESMNMRWNIEDAEKFAELIVRECMNICKQHPSRILSNNWNVDAVAPDLVHRFEEHFGVEE